MGYQLRRIRWSGFVAPSRAPTIRLLHRPGRPDTVGDIDADLLSERGPGRGIRLFVAAFLGLFLISGLAGVEAWPLTGWRLYSRVVHGDFWGWQVLAVGADGVERPVDLRHLPAAYHGVPYLLNHFDGLPEAEREAACAALGIAARAQYAGAAGVAIDHVLGRIPAHPHDPPSPPSDRIRVHQCTLE